MEPDTCPASVEVELKASKLVESAVMQQTTLSGTSINQPEASSAMVQAEVGCIRTTSGRKSFEELLLDMVKKEKRPENTEKKRKRIVKNCEIITTNEYLIKKEIEEKEKEDKEKDKKEKVKRKTLGITNKVKIPKVATKRKKLDIFINKKKRNLDFETDSSDDMDLIDIVEENEKNVEDEVQFQMLCTSDQPLDHFSHLKKIKKNIGEYVIFKYEGEFFPGKIVSLSEEHVEITAMKKSLKSWKWPDKADIEKYDWNDVIGAIEEPKLISKRGFYNIKELQNLWDAY
ncbi:hypothetical protein J6590_106667 [Homalodisca vitripennis]|nr:hypothetical protein J6590_106667 [Homalodisca vitripennis]